MDEGKKYLFVADPVNQWDFAEKIVDAFLRKAYLTNASLFLLMDKNAVTQNFYKYMMTKHGGGRIYPLYTDAVDVVSALRQVDFTILKTENTSAPIGYIETNGKKLTQHFANTCDDLFKDIPVPAEVSAMKASLSYIVERDFFSKFPPDEFEYFLGDLGLGESTAVFFWLKKYREFTTKKICCACSHSLRAEFFAACPYVDSVITIDPRTLRYISLHYTDGYKFNWMVIYFSAKAFAATQEHIQGKREHYGQEEAVRDVFNIPPGIPFEKYPFNLPTPQVESAKKIFHDMNLTEGKVVFVATEANYFQELSEIHADFWLKLRDKINSVGYEVITNGPKEDIPNCRNVFLPLFQSAAFAGLCGHIVSIPTGFVEAICAVNMVDKITLQTLHPADNDKFWETRKAETFKDYSFKDVDKIISEYAYTTGKYFSENIDCTYRKFGNDSAEDDALIEKIVEKILR